VVVVGTRRNGGAVPIICSRLLTRVVLSGWVGGAAGRAKE
jgi:hypothetical protein